MLRDDVASTSVRRNFDVMCPLGLRFRIIVSANEDSCVLGMSHITNYKWVGIALIVGTDMPEQEVQEYLTHWTRISFSTGVRDFSIPACCLSLGSESCLNLPIIASCSPIMFISTPQFVTCHVNFMQNMKLTPSDLQEKSQ